MGLRAGPFGTQTVHSSPRLTGLISGRAWHSVTLGQQER